VAQTQATSLFKQISLVRSAAQSFALWLLGLGPHRSLCTATQDQIVSLELLVLGPSRRFKACARPLTFIAAARIRRFEASPRSRRFVAYGPRGPRLMPMLSPLPRRPRTPSTPLIRSR
jgi:hypothetical protein